MPEHRLSDAAAPDAAAAEKTVDVTAIGNAIVDVVARADAGLPDRLGIARGAMTLVDADGARRVGAALASATGGAAPVEISGGSAANTAVGLASLGARAAYIGKVNDDRLGRVFARDIGAAGVRFGTAPAAAGPATGRCVVIVTPDAQRSMCTFLGAATELGASDVDPGLIAASRVIYLEGYLWDTPHVRPAFVKAARIARAAGGRVALSLSDPFCVERHRSGLRALAAEHVDILLGNEEEVTGLYQVRGAEAALAAARRDCATVAVTLGPRGSLVAVGGDCEHVAAEPVTAVVDTTGAGDLYAAGFLYGLISGRPAADCGRLGAVAAAEIISHFGARPETGLHALAKARLG